MKKLIISSTMLGALVLVAAMAYGAGNTLAIPWFVNDPNGVFTSNYDTWITLKNVTNRTITLTLDYYDNGDYTQIATTDTVVVPSQGVGAIYTGKPAYSQDLPFIGTGFRMGTNCDMGSINVRWPDPDTKFAREEITGYVGIENFDAGTGLGINFTYSDEF